MTLNQKTVSDVTQRQAAKIAGFGLILMVILGPFAYLFVFQSLIVPDNAAETTVNIMDSEGLFRSAIVSLVIVVILDVVVAWALYVVLKPVNKSLSLLASTFRWVYAAIFGVAVSYLYSALRLLVDVDYATGFESNQLNELAMFSIDKFNNVWNIGLIIFGLHLLILGYLVFKSGFFPKFLGVLLVIASLGYTIDSFGVILSPNYNVEIAMFAFVGEVLLIVWLFLRGVKGFERK